MRYGNLNTGGHVPYDDGIYRVKEEYIAVVLKMIGIAYISEFTATLCKDAGQPAIACQVDFFGKMSMVVVSLPVLQTLLETIGEMMP